MNIWGWQLGGKVDTSLPMTGRWPNKKLYGGLGYGLSVRHIHDLDWLDLPTHRERVDACRA